MKPNWENPIWDNAWPRPTEGDSRRFIILAR
jgi:hypothetical protein